MKYLACLYTLLVMNTVSFSQSGDSARAVKVLGRAQQDRILLRWAVTDPVSWQYANKYGYKVERFTILRDGKLLKVPVRKVLTETPLRPAAQQAWESAIDRNDYAAVAAQSIFGDSFEVSPAKKSAKQDMNLMDIVNKSNEMEQRFSFALFAADHSYEAAVLSGLALTDSSVLKNEKYFYKIYTLVPANLVKIDTGAFYVGLADYADLPQPADLMAAFSNRQVKLQWPVNYLQNVYVSYVVERSEDHGKSYTPINDKPFLNTQNSREAAGNFMKLDSIDNNKEYYYRVRGTTPFGEAGPPSDAVKGMGVDPLTCDLAIHQHQVDEKNKTILLRWTLDCKSDVKVQGYEVQRSSAADGVFKMLNNTLLPPVVHEFKDNSPLPTNYYKIIVKGNNGQQRSSFPVLIQLADSIPPGAPINLKIAIDTTGIVKLSWQSNTEPDLLGYRVFRSNFANDEYAQITVSALKANAFKDSINLKTLTKKIYYKVAAVDTRFNMSAYSIPVDIVKPDIVPPVPPVFRSVKSITQGVELTWIASSSEDVQYTVLLRRHKHSVEWNELVRVNKDSVTYTDKIPDARNEYQYKLIAVDDAGNESVSSKALWGKRLDNGTRPVIKDLKAEIDRVQKQVKLKWVYEQERIAKYSIYRASNNEPLTLYKSIPADSRGFIDTGLTMTTVYHYRVKAVFKDGAESSFSDELKVEY